MKQRFFKRAHCGTAWVWLDTEKCEACWKCISSCPNQVIGRVNLPWHKHARFVNREVCAGCMKCVQVCRAKAITQQIRKEGGN